MSEVKERSSYSQKIPDKATVEINEAYKSLYISSVLSQTSFGHISINSSTIPMVLMAPKSP